MHTPGVKVAIPSTPADAKGLLAAIRDPDPVVVLEPKLHYRTEKADVPDGGAHRPARPGAHRARGLGRDPRRLRGDGDRRRARGRDPADGRPSRCWTLRTLKPLDEDALASVAKTGRAVVVQEAICGRGGGRGRPCGEGDLRPPGPVLRGDRLRRPLPTGRSRTRTCPRSSASSTPCAGCSRRSGSRSSFPTSARA